MKHTVITFTTENYKFTVNGDKKLARCHAPDFTFDIDGSIKMPTGEDLERIGGEDLFIDFLSKPSIEFANLQEFLVRIAKEKDLNTKLAQLAQKFGFKKVADTVLAMAS